MLLFHFLQQQNMRRYFYFILFLFPIITWAQSINATLQHGGLTREYSVYVPTIYDASKPTPLVLNLHGYTSVNWQQEFYGDFRPIADTANFIIVHPNGTVDANNNRYWNVGFFPSSIDDVGFLLALIDSLSVTYNIDANRIYSTGMSNGGFMSYKLACETPRFAAIASVTGGMTSSVYGTCAPTKPIPVMEIHGTADGTVAYTGSAINLHTDSVVSYWRKWNNCDAIPVMINVPNTVITDGVTAEHYVYGNGDNGTSVELYKIIGGGHTWPGASFNAGVTCMDFSASKEIWRFFSQYSLSTDVENAFSFAQKFVLSPNPADKYLQIEAKEGEIRHLQVLDMTGKNIFTKELHAKNYEIAIKDWAKGLYILQISDGKRLYTQKWVKN